MLDDKNLLLDLVRARRQKSQSGAVARARARTQGARLE
jgi:hypothetical protein